MARDNQWVKTPGEALWIGQEIGVTINEGKRYDLKLTIRLKEGETSQRGFGTATNGYTETRSQYEELKVVERREKRDVYEQRRTVSGISETRRPRSTEEAPNPNWQPICYEKYCKCTGCNQNPTQPLRE